MDNNDTRTITLRTDGSDAWDTLYIGCELNDCVKPRAEPNIFELCRGKQSTAVGATPTRHAHRPNEQLAITPHRMNTTFDITAYLQQLTAKNKMAAELNFQHTTCSGINYLEEPLQLHRPLLHAFARRARAALLRSQRVDTMSTHKPIDQYTQEWYDKMTQIWRDRLTLMQVRDTGRLQSSVIGASLQLAELDMMAAFRFVEYGMAVDAGSGKYYDQAHRNERGQLSFLDAQHRYEKRLKGRTRQRRPWFSISWAISRRVIADRFAIEIGDRFVGLFDNLEE
ncbi:MAG: hypothetical protein HUK09_08885 [Bacteroidaceae bacterium]|nr:hypothetical protein [Bacteroidaceae bacterium]